MARCLYFDTSFLVHAFCCKIDFLGEIVEKIGYTKILVPSTLLNELAAIEGRGGKFALPARLAREFLEGRIKSGKVAVVRTNEKVDAFILARAERNDIVCTNDKELRKILKKKGIKTAITRGKSILV